MSLKVFDLLLNYYKIIKQNQNTYYFSIQNQLLFVWFYHYAERRKKCYLITIYIA